MESLDTTILNTAVPTVARSLDVQPLSMKAVLACYTLSLAIFIPISGWTANKFGTRRVYTSAIGLFTLASLLCALSRNIQLLVAFRILQGCGGAMMLPVGRLVMVRTFAKHELINATSFVAIPGLIGPMLGPLAGGLIIRYFHWSVIFWVNIPIGLAGIYLVDRYLPDYRVERNPRLDVIGLLLFGCGISLLSYVLEVFGDTNLTHHQLAALAIVSAGLLIAYGLHSMRIAHPLLKLDLLRIRSFRVAIAANLATRLGIGGTPFLLPLMYQIGLGFSPIQSGLLILPQALAAISLKMTIPRILKRFGYRRVLIVNTLLLGGTIMLFSMADSSTPWWLIASLAYVFGFMISLHYTSMNTLAYADIGQDQASGASSIASTVQQLAMSLGVAIASLTATFFIPAALRGNAPQMLHGIHLALLVMGWLTFISTLVFAELKPGDGAGVSRREPKPR